MFVKMSHTIAADVKTAYVGIEPCRGVVLAGRPRAIRNPAPVIVADSVPDSPHSYWFIMQMAGLTTWISRTCEPYVATAKSRSTAAIWLGAKVILNQIVESLI